MNTALAVVSLLSVVVAALMSFIAWRLIRSERERSEARVAELAEEIHGRSSDDFALEPQSLPPPDDLFTVVESEPQPSRFALAATVVLVLGGAAAIAVVLGALGRPGQPTGERVVAEAVRGATTAAPLELLALGHEREADGLIVRGVLRNPANGARVDALTAVVLVLNREGGVVASGRAAVEPSSLAPGRETAFVVTVPAAGEVDRYRVSFRNNREVVPHVDHRS